MLLSHFRFIALILLQLKMTKTLYWIYCYTDLSKKHQIIMLHDQVWSYVPNTTALPHTQTTMEQNAAQANYSIQNIGECSSSLHLNLPIRQGSWENFRILPLPSKKKVNI